MLHVPYKGSAPAIADLVAGRTIFMFDTFAATNGHVKAGTLKRIAVASKKRSRAAPDLPTMTEQGFPVEAYSWSGIFAPAKTPKPDRRHAVRRVRRRGERSRRWRNV